ncbi:MAG: ATP-binding protein [Bacteroidales bacterium]|nr:ATP-binding protein [Candidatus Colicola coprequi]
MTEHVFERKIYADMLAWKQQNEGRSALMIEGARRVGKSTVVEQFAQKEYRTYILIDFNKAGAEVCQLFEDSMEDLDHLFLYLQSRYHTILYPRESVIVFDEVQQCPKARQAIKYLVADGRYDYIETGSLISIKKNTESITIPSEEDRLEMFPMDYEEFLWALSDHVTIPLLAQSFSQKRSMGDELNRVRMRSLRLYMLVGGMPQAVCTYLETKNMKMVDATKRKIIKLYEDDFRKLDTSGKLGRLFMSIPSQLSRGVSRFTPTSVIKGVPAETMENLLTSLEDSKTVNVCYHADDPNVGLSLEENKGRYKLFIGDTGLMVTLCFWDKKYTENVIYEKLLSDKLSVNLGYIYENLVAQMLRAAGNKLFYYTFPKDEKHNYEIDFLLSQGTKLCPIEVKSEGYKSHKSLDAFCEKFSSRVNRRVLIYTKDFRQDGQTMMIPIYMTPLL